MSTAELRRRGYDVTAGMGSFKAPQGEWNSQHALDIGWRDPDTGESPKFVAVRGATKKSDTETVRYFNKNSKPGARGFVTVEWLTRNEQLRSWGLPPEDDPAADARKGHILCWEKKGNRIVFHDPQTGETGMSSTEYFKLPMVPGSLRMVRIDDCEPVDGVLDVLGGDEDLWR